MTPEQQAEIERIRRAHAKFSGATVQTSAAVIVAALDEAQAEAEKWHGLLKQDCDDWAETDTHLRNAAKKILSADTVDGSKFGVPSIETVVDAVVAEAERLRAENARLREALGYYAKREDWESWNGSDYCQFLNAACDGWETAERALAVNETPAA